jgi:hypothetical protein
VRNGFQIFVFKCILQLVPATPWEVDDLIGTWQRDVAGHRLAELSVDNLVEILVEVLDEGSVAAAGSILECLWTCDHPKGEATLSALTKLRARASAAVLERVTHRPTRTALLSSLSAKAAAAVLTQTDTKAANKGHWPSPEEAAAELERFEPTLAASVVRALAEWLHADEVDATNFARNSGKPMRGNTLYRRPGNRLGGAGGGGALSLNSGSGRSGARSGAARQPGEAADLDDLLSIFPTKAYLLLGNAAVGLYTLNAADT